MDARTLQLAAGIPPALASMWAPHVTAAMARFGIDTPQRQAAFIPQISHESAGFTQLRESLNYSVQGLRTTFRDRVSADDAARLGRKDGEAPLSAARQMAIANLVYGGRYGNNSANDGWTYRGGGLKQITFLANYAACRDAIGFDLVTHPELITTPEVAALSAGWFWKANNCNHYADTDDFVGLTRKINGGVNGLDERRALWRVARPALGLVAL